MSTDLPLTCYICGEVDWDGTMDMIGCLKKQDKASERFFEKYGHYPNGYLHICYNCYKNKKEVADRVIEKYGMYGLK